MTDFKAKMHQIRFRLGLTALPRPPAGFRGHLAAGEGLRKRRDRGREGEVEGREREGPNLLLNHGPSEPCYATALT